MKTKQYKRGGDSLMEIRKIVRSYFPNEINNVLDIAGYKPPEAVKRLAKWYKDSQFTYFKEDNIRINKISPATAKIKNLDIVSSYRQLNNSYNLALAIFTLHELKKPKKSLKRILKKMTPDGKFICVDYDLNWFSKLSSENKWDLDTQRSNFSKYLFIEENENRVMGMKNGKNLPKKKIDEKIIEENCVHEHTKLGIENYLDFFSELGLNELESISYNLQTPWGEKPKFFLYIGQKN